MNEQNRQVLYVARAGLPIDATGLRIAQIGKMFRNEGYSVHYLCDLHIDGSEKKNGYYPIDSKQDLDIAAHSAEEVHFEHDGCVYSYLSKFSGNKLDAIKEMMRLYTASSIYHRICRVVDANKPAYIVLYNATAPLTKRLIPYCRKHGIKLLGDVTEWYDKKDNATLAENFIVASTDKRITKYDAMMDGIISISPYFHDYYKKSGVNSVLIPPLMTPVDKTKLTLHQESEPIRFVYAGSPGSKDIILPFVEAIIRANKEEQRFRIDLIGIDLNYLIWNGCSEASNQFGVYAHGRLSHTETVSIVKQADLGVLLRHDKRYAKAGFSTKFAECMSLGVGMVCNKIGGTDLFVEDGVDGFLLESIDDIQLDEFLDRVSDMSRKDIEQMRRNALHKAYRCFAKETYIDAFREFIERVNEYGSK